MSQPRVTADSKAIGSVCLPLARGGSMAEKIAAIQQLAACQLPRQKLPHDADRALAGILRHQGLICAPGAELFVGG